MPLMTREKIRIMLSAYTLAAVLGIVAATVPSLAESRPVSAAGHCTNYYPVPYDPDTHCNDISYIPNGGWGQTESSAIRENNCISTPGWYGDRWVWYGEYTPIWAYGSSVCQPPSNGYQVAGCKQSGSNVNGRCRTDW
jgi:hypothetical protein